MKSYSEKIRWGIVGTGAIAREFASDLLLVPDAELLAVGSRKQASADAFAQNWGVPRAYPSYEALAQDPDLDALYIATPHSLHRENTLLGLDNGKAILTEKPFAMNTFQAEEMFAKARENACFVMEAFWTRFLPSFQLADQLVKEGKIGKVQAVLADFGFPAPYHPESRLFDPALGGGSLLDVGLYPVFVALHFLGAPHRIEARASLTPTGVDKQLGITFSYKRGAIANLFSSLGALSPSEAHICGTEGRLVLGPDFYGGRSRVKLYRLNDFYEPEFAHEGLGYQYEVKEVHRCLRAGLLESPLRRAEDTLLLMETLDEIRDISGIRYRGIDSMP